jgi:hypothetical protein
VASQFGAAKQLQDKDVPMGIKDADVAELVDARDLKSLDGNVVWVRVPPRAPPAWPKHIAEEVVRYGRA